MNLQLPSTLLLEVLAKLSRYPIGLTGDKIHGGSATELTTKVKIMYLATSSGTGKLHVVGHKSFQCNFNGYIEQTCNPELQNGNTIYFNFLNQAFRKEDPTFGRLWWMQCASPEVANKVFAIFMLGVAAANQDYQREQHVARTALSFFYDAETASEGEEESKEEGKKNGMYYTIE